ncbi:hypothetical protein [Bradyrhizobium symbiodeficiens]|uniref:hypothetical protein n=1 Tax=Bradyrhizobium symbiodeficiens TaxID=1404367 RepID=UPI00140FEB22|nr:hypothetical protein [Bradyrhizobium symbiodeficiens]QIO98791.1 hypothetical protein HAU86_02735 [Bradyrhizobium symbiodeficiens]
MATTTTTETNITIATAILIRSKSNGLLRAAVACCGCLLAGWAAATLPMFRQTEGADRTAAAILTGRSFPTELVTSYIGDAKGADVFGFCRASTRRSLAVLNLYLYEEAFNAGRADLIDTRLRNLLGSVKAALHCAPADAYLWLLLFSFENASGGFKADNLAYLRTSYLMGPHEGWIAIKRNPVALAMLPGLDSSLAQTVLDEFASLVQNGLYEESAAIFAAANPIVRDRLLARLAKVPQPSRERFAKALGALLPSVAVPGIDREDDRPWRR